MKRYLHISLVMLITLFIATNVLADVTVGDVTYGFYTSGNAYVKSYSGTDTEITIPATVVNGSSTVNVVGIGADAFAGNTTIEKIIFSYTAGSYTVGARAFKGCTALKELRLTNGTAGRVYLLGGTVNESTFEGCTSITNIYSRYANPSIGNKAFKGCTALATASLGAKCSKIGDNAFEGCTALTSLLGCTDATVSTTIGKEAFKGCTALTQFASANPASNMGNITSIGDYAFQGCTSLKYAYIHATTVGKYAFEGCSSLLSPRFMKNGVTIGEGAFMNCTDMTMLYYSTYKEETNSISNYYDFSAITAIPAKAFMNCTSLKQAGVRTTDVFTISGITSVGESAFEGCTSLEAVALNNNKSMSIKNSAFKGCTSLKTIKYTYSGVSDTYNKDDQVVLTTSTVSESAFEGCTSITTIRTRYNNTKIGANAFAGCTSLTTAWLSVVVSVGDHAFKGSGIVQANIGTSTYNSNCIRLSTGVTIGTGAFEDCNKITVVYPIDIEALPDEAFKNCVNLQRVWQANNLTTLGNSVFEGCTRLNTYGVSTAGSADLSHVTSLGKAAFKNTIIPAFENDLNIPIPEDAFYGTKITSVTLDQGVTSIGAGAFNTSTLLEVTSLNEAPFAIAGKDAENPVFSTTTFNNAELFVPNGKDATYQSTDGWKDFANIEAIPNVDEGLVFSYATAGATVIGYTGTNTEIEIPTTVLNPNDNKRYKIIAIADEAFKDNTAITSVNIEKNVTTIGASAFEGCTSLTTVSDITNVTSIGEAAFKGCTSLQTVGKATSLTTIGASAFENCTSLETFSAATSCTYLKTYGDRAFKNCESLTQLGGSANTVLFGTSANTGGQITVGNEAFYGCSSIQRFSNNANVSSIGESAFEGCTALGTHADGAFYSVWKVAEIPAKAFKDCKNLGKAIFSTVTEDGISQDAFKGIGNGTIISLPWFALSDEAFARAGLTDDQVNVYLNFTANEHIKVISSKKSFNLNSSSLTVKYVSRAVGYDGGVYVETEATPSKVLPANTALIVQYTGTSSAPYYSTLSITDATASYNNKLVANTEGATVAASTDELRHYLFTPKNDKDFETFTELTTATKQSPGSGYLEVDMTDESEPEVVLPPSISFNNTTRKATITPQIAVGGGEYISTRNNPVTTYYYIGEGDIQEYTGAFDVPNQRDSVTYFSKSSTGVVSKIQKLQVFPSHVTVYDFTNLSGDIRAVSTSGSYMTSTCLTYRASDNTNDKYTYTNLKMGITGNVSGKMGTGNTSVAPKEGGLSLVNNYLSLNKMEPGDHIVFEFEPGADRDYLIYRSGTGLETAVKLDGKLCVPAKTHILSGDTLVVYSGSQFVVMGNTNMLLKYVYVWNDKDDMDKDEVITDPTVVYNEADNTVVITPSTSNWADAEMTTTYSVNYLTVPGEQQKDPVVVKGNKPIVIPVENEGKVSVFASCVSSGWTESLQSGIVIENVTTQETIQMGDANYMAYIPKKNLDLTESDLQAYMVIARYFDGGDEEAKRMSVNSINIDDSSVEFARIKKIPAGTPVILKGDANKLYTVKAYPTTVDDNEENLLQENKKYQTLTADQAKLTYLPGKNSKGQYGLYQAKEGDQLSSGAIFLKVTKSEASTIGDGIVFEGDATSISHLENGLPTDAHIYNMQGVRVSELKKGDIYIINGKKVLKK